MTNSLQNRTYLHQRHHLSHQQIDRWLGENRSKEFVQEKLKRLNAVKLFLDITDRFRENGIPFVCLKGPMLSYRIYGDPAVRLSSDIDLLIQLENMDAILKLMSKDGYQIADNITWPEKKMQQELFIGASHHLRLLNKQLECWVELHWTLMNALPIHKNEVKKLISTNLSTVDFAGRNFTVLNKEFELLYLMIHGAKHRWNMLKWLVDINDYPMSEINKDDFIKLVQQFKAERIIGQTNYFLNKYFNNRLPVTDNKELPAFFIQYTQKGIDNKIENNYSVREILRFFRYKLLLFPDWSYIYNLICEISISQGDVAKYNFFFQNILYIL